MVQADEDRASLLVHRLIEETWRALGHWDITLLDELAGVCRGLPTHSEWSLDKEIEEPVNRVTSLSQDPVAAQKNVLLLNQLQRDDSFTDSSSLVEGQLQVADSALGSVDSQLTQAISIATGGNNGTLNDSQRQAISNQLSGIRDEVLSLANTSYQGQYIFGGSTSTSSSFTLSTASAPAVTTYNGDSNVNYLQTPNGQTIQLNLPGDQIFPASGSNSTFEALNHLIEDFASGASVEFSVRDMQDPAARDAG